MSQVVRVRIEERESLATKGERPDLILLIYDTAAITRINERDNFEALGLRPIYVPAKYALILQGGREDEKLIAQGYAIADELLNEAVWFDGLRCLPVAIGKLREKFPQVQIPEQVDFCVDWPMFKEDWVPGSTIVEPVPPIVKKSRRTR